MYLELKSVLMEQKDFLTPIVREAVQTILELESPQHLKRRNPLLTV